MNMRNPQAHHDLPVKYRKQFNNIGIDIDDVRFGRWVEGSPPGRHQNWSRAYNREWKQFWDANPEATPSDVLRKMKELRRDPRFQ